MGDFVDGVVGNVKAVGNAVVDGVKAVGTALTGGGNSIPNSSSPDYLVKATLNNNNLNVGDKTPDGGVVVKDLITGVPTIIYPQGKKDPNDVEKDNDNNDPQQSDGGEDDNRDEVVNENSGAAAFQTLLEQGYTTEQAQKIIDGDFVLPDTASITKQTEGITLTEGDGTTVDGTDSKYNMDTEGLDVKAETAGEGSSVNAPDQGETATYETKTTKGDVENVNVNPITGEIDNNNLVNSDDYEIDMSGSGTGTNEDGSINQTGVALDNFAGQGIAHVIDTSTTSGKLLAEQLGAGNYTDTKATVIGQLDIISSQFVDADGNPKIPAFVQKTARTVARTMAFSGVTGTASLAAMSTALMEACLPYASEDASFFQTLTTKNLDNRQESIINKAKTLAKFDELNLSARETAAVTNAKHFLEMDLKNLDIENEAEVINKQNRVDAIFEDAKAVNAQRLFTAQETNDSNQFYDQLSLRAAEFTANSLDAMKRFNTGEINDTSEFNADLRNNREKFYQEMQFGIDVANAKWRQTIKTTNTEMQFDAASDDAKNMFDLTSESLNQIWDSVDSILDYAWQSGENQADRETKLAVAQMQGKAGKTGFLGNVFRLIGAFTGTSAGSGWIVNWLNS